MTRTLNAWAKDIAALAAQRGKPVAIPGQEGVIFARCHGYLVKAFDEISSGAPPLYCENLCHNPCPDCCMASGECDSLNRSSKPMGAAVEAVRAVMELLLYLNAAQVDVDGLMLAVYEHDHAHGVREKHASAPSLDQKERRRV